MPGAGGQWALALSGGGIRAATFSLGVLQGLARTPDAQADPGLMPNPELAGPADKVSGASPRQWPLLAQFDYLSTVSGGGYIGGFFSSLFVNGRLSGRNLGLPPGAPPAEPDEEVVQRAYSALQDDPPTRINRHTAYNPDRPGAAALAWLRDNGRYLAPSGAGDLMYGITVAIRNWFATHYVVATLVLMVLALLQSLRWWLAWAWPWYAQIELGMLLRGPEVAGLKIWLTPMGVVALAASFLAVLPLGMAFWFSHPGLVSPGMQRLLWGSHWQDRIRPGLPFLGTRPKVINLASLMGLGAGLMLVAVALEARAHAPGLTGALLAAAFIPIAAALCFTASAWVTRHETVSAQRVLLTKGLANALTVSLALAGTTLAATLGQSLWLHTLHTAEKHISLAPVLMGAVVWAIRWAAKNLGDSKGPAWLSKIPVSVLAGVVGGLLWLGVAIGVEMLLLTIIWPSTHEAFQAFVPQIGAAPAHAFADDAFAHTLFLHAGGTCLTVLVLVLIVGQFPGYLNLSTFQSLYSARLTRAYLGATNFLRFASQQALRDATAVHADAAMYALKARDVAEPIPGDSLDMASVHANVLAPIHLVNVCLNQSVSPGEQLVQRDRKGRPLTIAPGGFYLDGTAHAMPTAKPLSELAYPLSFGEWLGVSGAAFSTGLGRQTGLGMSLALGFANVRLGRWWMGLPDNAAMQRRRAEHPVQYLLSNFFPTQAYLLDELRGLFYGDHRPYQYLSDGGHFENTAVFELLRPAHQRDVRLIVVTDCGADPLCQFDDLANLIRLVRIDHGLEIQLNAQVLAPATGTATAPVTGLQLAEVFGRPSDFTPGQPRSGRCAVLLDVVQPACQKDSPATSGNERQSQVVARIVLLKPTMLAGASVDIDQYQATHQTFPQETTIDQFFDEAQWESYRKLGLLTAQRVFSGDGSEAYRDALWTALLGGVTAPAGAGLP
jgi:hypothetical protein